VSALQDRFVLGGAEQSVIARLDARTRLLATLVLVLTVVALKGISTVLAALGVALVLVWLAGLPTSDLRHRLLHVEGFMIVLLALLPFTVPGRPLWELGPLAASEEGVHRALMVVLKVNACVLAVFALLAPVDPVRLGHAMARLGVPLKLVHLFLFAVRYLHVLRAETGRLLDAMRVRAFVPRSSWHGLRTLGNLIGMMLVRSVERAERVGEAMRCRGFAGRLPLLATESAGRVDFLFGGLALLIVTGLILADRLI
jgi:cobalt/nickel transport system permease protein